MTTMGRKTETTIAAVLHLLLISTLVVSTAAIMRPAKGLIPAARSNVPAFPPAKVVCKSVYGVEGGDTCTSVGVKFGLSDTQFLAINPNVSCNTLFVGQWLCHVGTA